MVGVGQITRRGAELREHLSCVNVLYSVLIPDPDPDYIIFDPEVNSQTARSSGSGTMTFWKVFEEA
jgi:hypothetical protein